MSAIPAPAQPKASAVAAQSSTSNDSKGKSGNASIPFYEKPFYGLSKSTVAYWRKEGVEFGFMSLSTALLNPIERLRTLRQTRATIHKADRSKTTAVTSIDYLKSLFRGSTAGMMSWSLKLSLQTSYFERIRNYFFTEGEMNYTGGAKLLRKLVAATICSILSFAVSYPFEMTRTLTHIDLTPVSKSQAATVGAPPPKGFAMGGFRKNMSAIKRWIGYFRGFVGGASTIVFHAPLSLLCYEAIYALKDNQVLQPAIQHLSIPGLAALSTAILTHPLDSIRKRCMVTHLGLKVDNPNAAKVAIKPLSQVFGELKAFGYSTPFQGMSLTLLRTIFAAAFIAAKRRPEYKQLERMPN